MGMEHRAPCNQITSSILGWGQKVKAYVLLKVVMLHIKLKGIEHRAPCKHILCPYILPNLRWGKKVKTKFSLKVVMLHIKYLMSGSK